MENIRNAQKEFGSSYLNTRNLLEDPVVCGSNIKTDLREIQQDSIDWTGLD
jgi:hypothetical protein